MFLLFILHVVCHIDNYYCMFNIFTLWSAPYWKIIIFSQTQSVLYIYILIINYNYSALYIEEKKSSLTSIFLTLAISICWSPPVTRISFNAFGSLSSPFGSIFILAFDDRHICRIVSPFRPEWKADKTTFINLNEMYVHLQNHVIYFTVSDVSHTP